MRSIGRKKKAAISHRFGKPLMDLIRAKIYHSIILGFWITREHRPEFHGLAFFKLLKAESGKLPIRDPPHTVGGDARSHIPVFRMDDKT
jgi:hypothetical protein